MGVNSRRMRCSLLISATASTQLRVVAGGAAEMETT